MRLRRLLGVRLNLVVSRRHDQVRDCIQNGRRSFVAHLSFVSARLPKLRADLS